MLRQHYLKLNGQQLDTTEVKLQINARCINSRLQLLENCNTLTLASWFSLQFFVFGIFNCTIPHYFIANLTDSVCLRRFDFSQFALLGNILQLFLNAFEKPVVFHEIQS